MEEEMERPDKDGVYIEEDDPPMLSSHALAALKEFLEEKQQSVGDRTTKNAERGAGEKVALVDEDWRLSQFWYDPLTAETIAEEVVVALCKNTAAGGGGGNPNCISNARVACVACPTLYSYIKKIDSDARVQLLEYDKRFEQYGSDFTFYDYNQPEDLPAEFKHAFQVVVADPPYLSKECLEKIAQTISFLAAPGKSYLLLITGELQKDSAAKLLGLYACGFRPQHSSKLGNEFRLFTNYDPGARLGGWEL